MTRPDWMTPGTDVAVLYSSYAVQRVTFTTIDRVLKRDVVLANGDRFNADRPTRSEGGSFGSSVELMRADDPSVLAAVERQKFTADRAELRSLLSDFETRVRDASDADELGEIERELAATLADRANQSTQANGRPRT